MRIEVRMANYTTYEDKQRMIKFRVCSVSQKFVTLLYYSVMQYDLITSESFKQQ